MPPLLGLGGRGHKRGFPTCYLSTAHLAQHVILTDERFMMGSEMSVVKILLMFMIVVTFLIMYRAIICSRDGHLI